MQINKIVLVVVFGLIVSIAFGVKYYLLFQASPAKRFVVTSLSGTDAFFQINTSFFREKRYAICIEGDFARNESYNVKAIEGIDVFVRLCDSKMNVVREGRLDRYLAHFPKGGYFVIAEFVGKGMFSREQTVIVNLRSDSGFPCDTKLFVTPSPIP